jgi:hypothetical protein
MWTEAQRLHSSDTRSGFERAGKGKPDVSDRAIFFAPGSFQLDAGQMKSKWIENSRAGYYLGRTEEGVWLLHKGSSKRYDDRTKRVVMKNYYVQEEALLIQTAAPLMAPNNELLPNFPRNAQLRELMMAKTRAHRSVMRAVSGNTQTTMNAEMHRNEQMRRRATRR